MKKKFFREFYCLILRIAKNHQLITKPNYRNHNVYGKVKDIILMLNVLYNCIRDGSLFMGMTGLDNLIIF